jgi:hypothetical protein
MAATGSRQPMTPVLLGSTANKTKKLQPLLKLSLRTAVLDLIYTVIYTVNGMLFMKKSLGPTQPVSRFWTL